MATRKQQQGRKRARLRKHQSYKVFISHSSRDQWVAGQMAEKVAETGADFWLDTRDMPGGGDIVEEIILGIHECQEVIILFSPNSIGADWIHFELGAARAKRKRLTAILNNVNYKKLPSMLSGKKHIELNDFDQYLTELKKRIMKRMEKRK